MKKIIGIKSLALTCCAVGVLAASGQAWAIDNCTQITAQNEADVDSVANDKTDGGGDAAETFNNILTAYTADPTDANSQLNDDEDCAALNVKIIHDFGDAPASYGTTGATGAQHEVVPWLQLGPTIDDETDGAPNAAADGDGADEDGVSIPALTAGQTGPVITLKAPKNTTGADAYVACWIDYDSNGTFDAGEFAGATVPNGNTADITLTMPDVPAGVNTAAAVDTYARCRLSNIELTGANGTGVVDDSTGIADGEVEDYPVDFTAEQVFDLALTKALKAGQADKVNVGDDVTFTITVTNQGVVDATGIIITDYIPTGLTLNDANWTAGTNAAGDAVATLNAASALAVTAADGSKTVDITFTVAAGATGDLINVAEISAAEGGKDVNGNPRTDKDSDPDTVNSDTVKDDVINEDGKADAANDEDDHDIAEIHVNKVDIELTKRVLNKAGTAPITEAKRGDEVVYELTVTNKGPDTATGVVVSDRLPEGVTYVGSDAAAPSSYDPATGVWTIGRDLPKGATATLKITVTIDVKVIPPMPS